MIISIEQDDKAIKLGEKLRDLWINAEVVYGRPTKALEYANSKKIAKVIFLGNEEVSNKKLKLRDMKTGKELLVDEKEIADKLK